MLCELCGYELCKEFLVNPIVVHIKWARPEQPHVSAAASFSVEVLNEATTDSVLLAAVEQFEDQTTTRVLIAGFEEYEGSGTTQKEDVKKTPAKMLPSTHWMCTICILV